ncbi:MAG: MBL fold metallo-hydrolase [Pseudomonadota bacterium]
MNYSRRRFLHNSFLTSSTLALSTGWQSHVLAADTLNWQELTDGLALVQGAGGNVLVMSGTEGVALVDGGNLTSADALLALVKARTSKTPSLLFNTHCHRDQIGCNEVLGNNGATIIAHENTRLWLTTEILSKWENQIYPPLPAKAQPNKTFYYDVETLQFNQQEVRYGYLPQAHTDGDIYVHLPAHNVIVVGDVISVGAYPILDYATNGWIGGMINSLNLLLPLCDDKTRVIASSGIVDKAYVQQQLDMCSTLADRIGVEYYKGTSLPEFLAAKPTSEFDAEWGDPSLFLRTAWEGTLPHVTEIRRFGRQAR